MNILKAVNPTCAKADHSAINLDITIDGCGDVPFTASPDDSEAHGRELFARASSGKFGMVAEYIAPKIDGQKRTIITKIDADSDAIYAAALGNRETEYKQAEDEANAFLAACYSGDAPPYVQAWSSAKRKTAQWASDDILATALAWRTAQAAIRMNRLSYKEAARSATTAEELALVVTQWDTFVGAITAQLRAS